MKQLVVPQTPGQPNGDFQGENESEWENLGEGSSFLRFILTGYVDTMEGLPESGSKRICCGVLKLTRV